MAKDDEMSVNDFRNNLTIDQDNLEGCLVEHAQLFFKISMQAVNSNAERDAAKLRAEHLHADLDGKARTELSKNDGKVTETMVSNHIKNDENMQKAQAKLQKAKVAAEEWAALKEAFYQRGYMLRELVQLTLKSMSMDGEVAGLERTAETMRRGTGARASERQKEKYSKPAKVAKKASRR